MWKTSSEVRDGTSGECNLYFGINTFDIERPLDFNFRLQTPDCRLLLSSFLQFRYREAKLPSDLFSIFVGNYPE